MARGCAQLCRRTLSCAYPHCRQELQTAPTAAGSNVWHAPSTRAAPEGTVCGQHLGTGHRQSACPSTVLFQRSCNGVIRRFNGARGLPMGLVCVRSASRGTGKQPINAYKQPINTYQYPVNIYKQPINTNSSLYRGYRCGECDEGYYESATRGCEPCTCSDSSFGPYMGIVAGNQPINTYNQPIHTC